MTRYLKCFLLTLLLVSAGASVVRAQDVYDEWMGVYHPYQHCDARPTPPPRGYKPFYISHIGRHGSRYPVSAKYIRYGLKPLRRADSLGILTAEGERMLRGFEALDSLSAGRYGELCELGAREHRGIAERMAASFPQVFRGRTRDSVVCVATHKQRTISSMEAFVSSLQAHTSPSLKYDIASGKKYYNYLCAEEKAAPGLKRGSDKADSAMLAQMDFDGFYSRFFTDTAKARSLVKSDRIIPESAFTNGSVAAYLGCPELMHCLKPEEFETSARVYNAKMYIQHCGSAEQGEWRVHLMDALLRDFLRRADAAVAGNAVAADLRFSHDVGMMPFFSLIGLGPYATRATFEEASDVWNSSLYMCMATNLQMVFYRSRKGPVLVKFLLNEKETPVPALGEGPYYRWEDVRNYWIGILR